MQFVSFHYSIQYSEYWFNPLLGILIQCNTSNIDPIQALKFDSIFLGQARPREQSRDHVSRHLGKRQHGAEQSTAAETLENASNFLRGSTLTANDPPRQVSGSSSQVSRTNIAQNTISVSNSSGQRALSHARKLETCNLVPRGPGLGKRPGNEVEKHDQKQLSWWSLSSSF